MSEATPQPAVPGAPAPTEASPSPAPAAPEPGTPEHRLKMIADYDAQFAKPAPKPEVKTDPVVDPNALTPKLTDNPDAPKEEPKADETKDEAKESEAPAVNEALVAEFAAGFNAEKLPDTLVDALVKLGFPKDAIEQHHSAHLAGQRALIASQTQGLYQAAGGEASFKALVAWGQKNLSAEQQQFYDTQFNGPAAKEAIAVLQQRMNAGRDPSIALGNATASGTTVGFKDQLEVTKAMSDPRYWTDEAYHNSVKSRLAVSRY